MRLADMSVAKRRETVELAAGMVLRRTAGELGTYDLATAISDALGLRGEQTTVSRILADIAPKVPQARRGETFRKYGRPMQRWVWRGMLAEPPKPAGWADLDTDAQVRELFANAEPPAGEIALDGQWEASEDDNPRAAAERRATALQRYAGPGAEEDDE